MEVEKYSYERACIEKMEREMESKANIEHKTR